MDTQGSAENVSKKDENVIPSSTDPQSKSENVLPPGQQVEDYKESNLPTDSSQDMSEIKADEMDTTPSESAKQDELVPADRATESSEIILPKQKENEDLKNLARNEDILDSQPTKKEDTTSSEATQQGKTTYDRIEDSKETKLPTDSSQNATEIEAKIEDSQHKKEDIITPDKTADDEITSKETDSSQDKSGSEKNEMDYLPETEQDAVTSEKQSEPLVDQVADVDFPKEADSPQNKSDLIDKEPEKEDVSIVMPNEQTDSNTVDGLAPINADNQTFSPDPVGNNIVVENNTVIPSSETNNSTMTPDKANDNATVTVDNDVIPSKTNGTTQPSSSKTRNYCVENWLLVLSICLIILIIIGTIILAVIIVPILSQKVMRPVRLPGNVIPEHYVLEIRPYLIPDHSRFEGSVVITVLCVNPTNKLILHSKDLEIDEGSIEVVNLDGGHSPFVLKVIYDLKNEFVIFSLCENLQRGTKYDIHMLFKGKFAKNLHGFSMITYEKNNESKHMAVTKFESIYARTTFPCFDEPALKATFDINLVRWKNMTSLSNMEKLATVERDEHWEIDMYQRSIPMQTYLVAFVVGDLEKIQKEKISIWAAKDVYSYQFALNVTDSLLKFYESYLQVPYSISKLDQLATEIYSASAMENWGLIVYLRGAISSKMAEEKKIARIISHELAHQWFGNLVTMKWWDELWLNEGFAAYFGYFGAHVINPEWKMDEGLIEYIDRRMYRECNNYIGDPATIVKDFESTDEIKSYKREVIYNKGAALVRMMHLMLGDDTFRKGLKLYLEENSFQNVDQNDLWRYLTKAQLGENRIDMKKVFEPWTKQSYYPLITVTRRYTSHDAIIQQTSCTKHLGIESKDIWPVPITWIDKTQANYRNITVKLILDSERAIIQGLPGKETWILVNIERLGYFKVNYDENNWERLLWQLRHNYKVIPKFNRNQLISDSLYFAKINQLSNIVTLDILSYYPYEKEDIVLKALFYDDSLNYYGNMIRHTGAENYWKEFIHYLLRPTFIRNAKMWDEDRSEYNPGHYKWLSVEILCYEGYIPCLLSARKKFKDFLEGKALPKPFNINLLCALARNATREEWNHMNQFIQDDDMFLYSNFLACTEDDQLFQRWIKEYLVSNTMYFTRRLSDQRWRYIIEFLRNKWKEINRERREEILRDLLKQHHNNATLEMVNELYESFKAELSKDTVEYFDRSLPDVIRLVPSANAIKSVTAWLESRSWKMIEVRDIE